MAQTFRAIQASQPGGQLNVVEVDRTEPSAGHVRIAVEKCGVCHSDVPIIGGFLPGTTFPVTPGHEIVGRIDAVGEGVDHWPVGQRVAVGYMAGSCGHCEACREGDVINCPEAQIPGVAYPGGLAEEVIVPATGLSRVPNALDSADAAALACGGLSVFDALRNSAASPGDLVAILGLGGAGHLGVQFSARMGFDTVAVSHGDQKADLARELGAAHYIDSTKQNMVEELQELGGAKVVLATGTDAEAISAAVEGLGRRGELIVIGLPMEQIHVAPLQLVAGMKKIYGRISGTPLSREATFRFAAQTGIRPMTEQVPLDETGAAFERMQSSKARFRMVVDMTSDR